jgi:hypothetical protein
MLGVGLAHCMGMDQSYREHCRLGSHQPALSILVGIGLGIAFQNDVFYQLLRKLPFTDVVNARSAERPLPFLLSQNSAGKLKRDGDARPSVKSPTHGLA